VQGAKEQNVELTADSITVTATSESGEKYKFSTELFAEAVADSAKVDAQPRYISIAFKKKDEEADFWPRITKVKRKYHNISVDWAMWKEEDESEDEEEDVSH